MAQQSWDQCIAEQPLKASEVSMLSASGARYWRARQDGRYAEREDCTLAACDGSVAGDMGAAAVVYPPGSEPIVQYCKVAGAALASSFSAEAAAMSFAIAKAPKHIPLILFTDSMNVVHALQAWSRKIFCQDIRRQLNADIFQQILSDIIARSAPLRIVKVKSHRGVALNDEADMWAGHAAAAPSTEVDWYFSLPPPDAEMTFTWTPDGEDEPTVTSDVGQVTKRWHARAEQMTVDAVRQGGTMGGTFLTAEGQGRHLLQKSRAVRPWTEQEERRWMQLVGRVFPVNTYLRRIDKHPNGHCHWCKGVRETITHFQSCCPQFQDNRIAAHNSIARAVMGALAGAQLADWQFFYETPFSQLPFEFAWTAEEREEQENRRQDGVAWNLVSKIVLFLEFTRCMDHPHTLKEAVERKASQYDAAVDALFRAQERARYDDKLQHIVTLPLVFGVRGSVAYEAACESLKWFEMSAAKRDKVLACGVREAITGASELCTARYAALKSLPKVPRAANGKRVKVCIPPKPHRGGGWRSDRGVHP